MSLEESQYRDTRFFPSQVGREMRVALLKALALILMGLSALSLIALATWSASDPSFTTSTAHTTRNLLGTPGAILADFLVQGLGIAAPFFVLPLAFWGWVLIKDRSLASPRLRVMVWLLASLALAGVFASLWEPEGWPVYGGLGGLIGNSLYKGVSGVFSLVVPPSLAAPLTVFGLLAIGVASFLSAIGARLYHFELLVKRETRPRPLCETDRPWRNADRDLPLGGLDASPVGAEAPGAGGRPSAREPFFSQDGRPPHGSPGGQAEPPNHAGGSERLQAASGTWDRRAAQADVDSIGADGPERAAGEALFEPVPDTTSPGFFERFAPRRRPDAPLPDAGQPTGSTRPEMVDAAAPAGDEEILDLAEVAEAIEPAAGEGRAEAPLAGVAADSHPVAHSYRLPPLKLLRKPPPSPGGVQFSHSVLRGNARLLEDVLKDFGIKGEIVSTRPGPVVTQYELEPARGIKSARVIALAEDIARSMSAVSARVANVPGRNVIGIELPNGRRESVHLRELLDCDAFRASEASVPVALGKDIAGAPVVADLARMPHLLIAGTTGSGKSVGINALILSLLYKFSPSQCRMVMIDPKMLELSVYNGIPHLLTPVVTDPAKAVSALRWVVSEMEERYKRISYVNARNIHVFNNRVRNARKLAKPVVRTVHTGFDPKTGQPIYEREELDLEPMPFIVVVIDEMADLMMTAGKDVEAAVQRLAQMARAAGIHLVTATQRPSVDVITGTLKANLPTRVSYKVASKVDSRTILGEPGAEQLLGAGDLLYTQGGGRLTRIHGPFVSEDEIEQVVTHLRSQAEPCYVADIFDGPGQDKDAGSSDTSSQGEGEKGEELYDMAVAIILRDRKASTSYLQRRLSIGYNRAANLIEQLEQEKIISPADPTGKREVLVERL